MCECMLTLSNTLLMSSAIVIVHSPGLFWLNHVAMVLFMLCSAGFVEWLFSKPCCVKMCDILYTSPSGSMFLMPDVDFISPCGVS